ncbi:hypothetical protein C2E15_08860 [Mixta gaviniae]|uniref:Uncharacterized protein n=1 Tax=Mixta gaviniae TaxID=665914 RepID=A0A1X1DKG3_9GAMM|nr:hypothetical protein C2E15_08860 [Mixta gaviniae]ORM77134.1 hypothetical protein HA44_14550 [Mixta gaviniae]
MRDERAFFDAALCFIGAGGMGKIDIAGTTLIINAEFFPVVGTEGGNIEDIDWLYMTIHNQTGIRRFQPVARGEVIFCIVPQNKFQIVWRANKRKRCI